MRFSCCLLVFFVVSCTASKETESTDLREALASIAKAGQSTFNEIGRYPKTLEGLGFTPKAYPNYKIIYSGTREDNFKVTASGKIVTMTMENFSIKTITVKENKN